MAAFVNFCTENSISGVEEFAGLPGTVGGAVFMNARCFDKSISDVIFSVSYQDYSDSKIKLHQELYNPQEKSLLQLQPSALYKKMPRNRKKSGRNAKNILQSG